VLKLLEKLCEVYSFITQDEILGKISLMRAILGKISQQTRECAHFVRNYSETKRFCEFQQAIVHRAISSFCHYHREQTRNELRLGNGRYDSKVQ
jgi:hypothetical protein